MSKNLKYELTEEFISLGDKTLYRIKALEDFNNVSKGDLGGMIEKENNLSQEGDCWVYEDAIVFGNAQIFGNAKVYDHTKIFGNAQVYDYAQISDDAKIYGNAKVSGNSVIYGDAWIFDNAKVYDNARICGNAWVYGDAQIYGTACVYGSAKVYGGDWAVSPFYLLLSKHSITSCNYTHLKIGCEILTIEEWKEQGEEIGKENKYTDSDIAFYREGVLFAEKYIELAKKEAENG